jgi:hypothetical protein
MNCSFQHICATLESQVHTMSDLAGTRHAPRGRKSKFTRTRLQQQQVQNGTQLAHTHWQQHQYTHVFSSSKYTTAHTRHTHGTHTLAAASVHTRLQWQHTTAHTRHIHGKHTLAHTRYTHGTHTAHTRHTHMSSSSNTVITRTAHARHTHGTHTAHNRLQQW